MNTASRAPGGGNGMNRLSILGQRRRRAGYLTATPECGIEFRSALEQPAQHAHQVARIAQAARRCIAVRRQLVDQAGQNI